MPFLTKPSTPPNTPDQASPKFLKPKILLVDCEDAVTANLVDKGYNAKPGTFGSPYQVKRDDGFTPVIAKPSLPNLEEQEIVIIDLSPPETLPVPNGEKTTSLGSRDVWASNQKGEIDPRPRVMAGVHEALDRIVENGGVCIVFSEPVLRQEHKMARADDYRGLYDDHSIDLDNWIFLSLVSDYNLEKNQCSGTEVEVDGKPNGISDLLKQFFGDIRFSVSFQPNYPLSNDTNGPVFVSLAKNKFGKSVAGAIIKEDAKGAIFLLPHVADKPGLVSGFVTSVLPNLLPYLFPFDEKNNWLHTALYEHPGVIALKGDQERIRTEADQAAAEIETEIDKERERLGYLHGLLTKSGDELVAHVAQTLQTIGFTDVVDADSELEEADNKQEDLQIHDKSPTLLVEVKGLTGMPTEGDTNQVVKYIPRRMKEWNRTDVAGVVVVNHQKNLPPLDRHHDHVFTAQQVEDAINHDVLLVTTWELFRLARGKIEYDWPAEALTPLFYEKGRIVPMPVHWVEVGSVAHYYDQKSVVSIELSSPLAANDVIGFALPARFVQHSASDLHVDRHSVPTANAGQRVGIKTPLSRSDLPNGTKCYLVGQASSL